MSLSELNALHCWHRGHARQKVEAWVWETLLAAWLAAWAGVPVALLLQSGVGLALALSILPLPGLYIAARRQLHRRGRLRCDWLGALR